MLFFKAIYGIMEHKIYINKGGVFYICEKLYLK